MDDTILSMANDARFSLDVEIGIHKTFDEDAFACCYFNLEFCRVDKPRKGQLSVRLSTGEDALSRQNYPKLLDFLYNAKNLKQVSFDLRNVYVRDVHNGFTCLGRHFSCAIVRDIIHASRGAEIHMNLGNPVNLKCVKKMFALPVASQRPAFGAVLTRPVEPLQQTFFFREHMSPRVLSMFFRQLVATGHVKGVNFYIEDAAEESSDLFGAALYDAFFSADCALQCITVFEPWELQPLRLGVSVLLTALAHALMANGGVTTSLRHITLEQLDATAESLAVFFDSFAAHNNSLESIKFLDGTDGCQHAVVGAARFLSLQYCRLQVLDFGRGYTRDKDPVDISALCFALAGNKTVTHLILRGLRGGDTSAVALCDMLYVNKTLRIVDYSENPCFLRTRLTALTNPFCHVLQRNTTLQRWYLCETLSKANLASFVGVLSRDNFTLLSVSPNYCFCSDIATFVDEDKVDQCCFVGRDVYDNTDHSMPILQAALQRNRTVMWQKSLHDTLLEFCLALGPLQLPPYVLLEIFDWLPLMAHVRHYPKIKLVEGVHHSRRRACAKRDAEALAKK